MNRGIDVRGFKLLYAEQVWNPIEFNMEFGELQEGERPVIDKPIFLSVVVLNSDGNVRLIHDEAWRFQFVRTVDN